MQLTDAGRTLLEEAPIALAALERAVDRARLAAAGGVVTSLRLGYSPVTGFDTLPALLAAAEQAHPQLNVIAREAFSAAIPERLLAGDLDIGIALLPRRIDGVSSELLRQEPIAALLSASHRLAGAPSISLIELRDETLLIFPRPLAPAYYDRIVAACNNAGFEPRIQTFEDPPVNAMLARLPTGREVGLTPASFALQAASGTSGLLAREIVDPMILAELSMLWRSDDPSGAIATFLDSARLYSQRNGWVQPT